jgi:hypothetical protein
MRNPVPSLMDSFVDADIKPSFAPDGTLRAVSGRPSIPSPHERIAFTDPVQADIDFFSGREKRRSQVRQSAIDGSYSMSTQSAATFVDRRDARTSFEAFAGYR